LAKAVFLQKVIRWLKPTAMIKKSLPCLLRTDKNISVVDGFSQNQLSFCFRPTLPFYHSNDKFPAWF